jgi:GH141 insertion domain/Right handed beta helix region
MNPLAEIGERHMGLKALCCLAALICCVGASPAGAVTLYVSPGGNDAWSGTVEKTNAAETDGPLATLAGARDAVRTLKAQGPLTEPVEILIADGTYLLDETLVLTPEDSGTEACPVAYAAMPGAKPIISGGRAITGWEKGDAPLWVADVPEAREGTWYFHQLFVNGRRATRARTPNVGYLRTDGPIEPLSDRAAARKDTNTKLGFRFLPGDIRSWDNLDEANVFVYHSWTSSLHWIKELDETANVVRFRAHSGWPMGYWENKQRYHLENYFEALDAPGEWYLNPKPGKLYYWPLEGEDMTAAKVVAPKIGVLMRADGDVANAKYVAHIHFKGLSFQHADWLVEKDAVNDGQAAAFQRDAALTLTGARHFAFDQCEVAHVGMYAIWFRKASHHNSMTQCHIHDLGTGGVRIGEGGGPENDEVDVRHTLVENCWIHDGGHVFPAGHGVYIARASYNTVRRCDISDFYYTGIAIGWSWGYAPSTANHNVVEFCHIHHLGKGVLSDMGSIYSLGDSPGTRLTNNVMHDVYSYAYGGWGLYNDEGSTGIVMENNIVYNTKTGGYHQHYGKENVLRNNVFAFSKEGQIIRSREEEHISFILEGNIILVDNALPLGHNWSNGNYTLDSNLYWDVNGDVMDFADWTLAEWKERGQDVNSVVADPLFVDAANYDFRLKPESPAYALGFKDIDTSEVGLYGSPEWVDGPKEVVRTPVDVTLAQPPAKRAESAINDDFEDTAVGNPPKGGHVGTGGEGGVLAVTDETAAVGTHSLQFVDAPGLSQEWQPHLNYTMRIRRGTVKNSFCLRAEPGVRMYMEWRDWRGNPYKVGPNFRLTPEGKITASGQELFDFPPDTWVKFDIAAVVGADSPKTFDMTVTVPGQDPQTFAGLPFVNKEFSQLTWFGYSSTANAKQVFYVDDLHLNLEK